MTLVHNPKAGQADHSGKQLRRALGEAGHQVRYFSSKKDGWQKAVLDPGDLVLVAGGDGTVAKVARRLVGKEIPLSVLPVGTANNLAHTLGFTGTAKAVIASLAEAKPRRFDVGIASGPWGRRFVFEGTGGGLLAHYMWRAKRKKKKGHLSKRTEMKQHVAALRDLLARYRARKWKIIRDGTALSDRYLLFEALNINSIGPGLRLAPQARVGDSYFNLILVRESERELVSSYLSARLDNGRDTSFPLPARRFRELEVACKNTALHLDDDLPRRTTGERVVLRLSVQPAALLVLSN